MYDDVFKLLISKRASDDTNTRIQIQYVSQAKPQQGVKAAHDGRHGRVFSHAFC